jgi:hypothetical protein
MDDENISTDDTDETSPQDGASDPADAPSDDRAAAIAEWQRRRRTRGSSGSAAVVEVVSSDDPPPQDGFRGKLRSFLNSATGSDDSDEPRTGRGRRPQVKPEELAAGVIVPILAIAFLAVPPHVRMRQDEMHNTAVPLARILLRRVKALRRMSPDVIDLFAIMAAITVYVRRLQFESAQRAAARRAAEEAYAASRGNQRAANGVPGTSPGRDPLAAYLAGYGH